MTDDPFQLRRFGIYSEQDIAVTREMANTKHWMTPERAEELAGVRPPSLDAFLRYWTPERVRQRVGEELSD